MSGGYLIPGIADTIGNNPVVPDNLKIAWGTDSDVLQHFDGTKLVFEKSTAADVLTLNASTSAMELAYPGATSSAHHGRWTFFRDEDGDNWAETDSHGSIDFDALVGGGASRKTFFAVRSTGGVGISAAATVERGTGGIFVLQDGALFQQMRFEGGITPSAGAFPSLISAFSNLLFSPGESLLVGAQEAAFRYSGGLLAGEFFQAGLTAPANGFEFRDGGGVVVCRLTVDGHVSGGSTGSGVLVPGGTGTETRGLDTLAAGQLNIGRNLATVTKVWSDLEIDDANKIITGTSTGTEFPDTASQKIGFWGVTPIVQPANTVAIDTLLVNAGLRASGGVSNFATDVKLPTAGTGLYVKEGTNATMGSQALVAGVAVVATTKVTANSRIFAFPNALGGTSGLVRVTARTAGTSFTLTSTQVLDTSTYSWIIIEPS